MSSKRILLAEDHALMRRGITYVLQAEVPSAQLVEARTCAELLERLSFGPYDLLVLDVVLPDGNTLDVLPGLVARYPDLPILMYSMSAESIYADRAFALGAKAYVSKMDEEQELVKAARALLRGITYRTPSQELRLLDQPSLRDWSDPFRALSGRELTVMDYLLRGKTVGDIAETLKVTSSTAATYKARLFNKLGVTNLIELQRKAAAHGYGSS
ncbi:MAG: response regulator [Flavobacteriales bacterium]